MSMTDAQKYAVGLLVEEMGEAQTALGEGLRFGFDTKGRRGTAMDQLHRELGDVKAAIRYASWAGLVDEAEIDRLASRKFAKLCSDTATDNLGRRLAPHPDQGKAP